MSKTASGLSPAVLKNATTPLHRYGAIAQRLKLTIPESTEEADAEAEMLVGLTWGGNWATAALVSSRTEAQPGRRTDLAASSARLTFKQYAAVGLRGLTDRETVAFYAQVWESRFPKPIPGETVRLPDEPFPVRAPTRERPPPRDPPPLPVGLFDVLLADPPWRYDFVETTNRAIENQYPTLDVDAIASLNVPAADDAVLFLWATSPKLREALQVIEGWGFTYKTGLVWVKNKIGMGYWARERHELLLVATKGSPGVPDEGDRPDSVIEAPRGKHSEKPALVYDLIETALPDRGYLELFARTERDGWTSWGNEL